MWGHPREKEPAVPAAIAVVRNWFIEQVTAIHDVTRPLPVESSSRR